MILINEVKKLFFVYFFLLKVIGLVRYILCYLFAKVWGKNWEYLLYMMSL